MSRRFLHLINNTNQVAGEQKEPPCHNDIVTVLENTPAHQTHQNDVIAVEQNQAAQYDGTLCTREHNQAHSHHPDENGSAPAMFPQNQSQLNKSELNAQQNDALGPDESPPARTLTPPKDVQRNAQQNAPKKYRRWKEYIRLLRQYKDRYGDCNVPKRYPEDRALGVWVQNQRYAYAILQRWKHDNKNQNNDYDEDGGNRGELSMSQLARIKTLTSQCIEQLNGKLH